MYEIKSPHARVDKEGATTRRSPIRQTLERLPKTSFAGKDFVESPLNILHLTIRTRFLLRLLLNSENHELFWILLLIQSSLGERKKNSKRSHVPFTFSVSYNTLFLSVSQPFPFQLEFSRIFCVFFVFVAHFCMPKKTFFACSRLKWIRSLSMSFT